jgi:TM2 domain-containing membrane protein YozV
LKENAGPEMVNAPAAVAGTIPLSIMQSSVLAVFIIVLVTTVATGSPAGTLPSGGDSFLRDEFLVLGDGASGSWRSLGARSGLAFDQIGGEEIDEEFGGAAVQEEEEEKDEGPSNTGDKVKAGLLSAVLPGAGQFYNHQNTKGYIMVGVEVAIWTAYFVFDAQGDARMESAREWAGIYAGTSGEHENPYWQNVGHYMDSDAYNDSRLREARALQETANGLIGGVDAWQWVNEDRKDGYSKLRADGNSAYDRRDFMILFAVVNRAVSVVDAVLNAGKQDGILETEVLGMNVELEMLPSFSDPGARWVVSRSF